MTEWPAASAEVLHLFEKEELAFPAQVPPDCYSQLNRKQIYGKNGIPHGFFLAFSQTALVSTCQEVAVFEGRIPFFPLGISHRWALAGMYLVELHAQCAARSALAAFRKKDPSYLGGLQVVLQDVDRVKFCGRGEYNTPIRCWLSFSVGRARADSFAVVTQFQKGKEVILYHGYVKGCALDSHGNLVRAKKAEKPKAPELTTVGQ